MNTFHYKFINIFLAFVVELAAEAERECKQDLFYQNYFMQTNSSKNYNCL